MPSLEQLGASRPLRKQRRDKYIPKACQACRNRKIKCSGHDTCLNCVDRGTECIYNSERRKRGRKAVSRNENGTGDGGNSQADGQASPYDAHTLLDPISPVREPPGSSSTGPGYNPAPYAPLRTATRPRATAVTSIPVAAFQNGCEPSSMGDTVSFPLQLPPSFERSWLIQQYFDNFHPAYPFLDQEDFETRVSRTLAQLGCHATDREPQAVVTVGSNASSFLALVCAIWALGQSVSGVSGQAKRNDELADLPPGYSMWSSSRKLLQAFDGLRPPSVDTVRCYVLNCIYALHANMIDVSLQSHAAAARLLILTDSRTCQRRDQQGRSAGETNLWWNIFILDRTLSRMSNTRYMLRLDQLPYEIQRDLEAPWWQEQRCSESSPGVSELASQLGRNEIAAVDGDVLCLRAMGSLCNMWSVYSDEISKPRRGNCCTLRQTALLDTELQVFADSLPAELQWGGSESPSIPNGAECNSTRQLLIFLSTNLLRLLLRRASPMTCNCFVRTKTGDGRGIACETIRACSKAISPAASGPFARGIAITVTTALVYSISLFLGILDDEHDDEEESERISGLIEEGYGFLMQLVPSCKFASSAVSSLDERLFSSENDPELRSSKSSDPVAIGLDTLYDDEVAQGAILAEGLSPARDPLAAGASVEMESGNNPLQDLETGYGDLDSISLGRL